MERGSVGTARWSPVVREALAKHCQWHVMSSHCGTYSAGQIRDEDRECQLGVDGLLACSVRHVFSSGKSRYEQRRRVYRREDLIGTMVRWLARTCRCMVLRPASHDLERRHDVPGWRVALLRRSTWMERAIASLMTCAKAGRGDVLYRNSGPGAGVTECHRPGRW